MKTYSVTAPNGKTYQVTGPEGASNEQVISALLAIRPDAGEAPAETTAGGQAKEFVKGLAPGAVNMLESAAVGASALLPDQYEDTVRKHIADTAAAARAPFAAQAGYEDSVGRKLGEGLGSMVPLIGTGMLGVAGKVATAGLALSGGAGEARMRAEKEGATKEERATATVLGLGPGALDAFPVMHILSRVPTAAKSVGVEAVKRALVAGGEEAAQEAASNFAQNLIAKGVYKPDQALVEGVGESAAYGGATGAIAQGLFDLALGRKARGMHRASDESKALEDRVLAAQEARARAAEPKLPEQAEPGAQGRLFPVERAPKPATETVEPTAEAPVAQPGQMDLGLEATRGYGDIALERARLEAGPQTPEVKARIAELRDTQRQRNAEDVVKARETAAQETSDAQKASESAFTQEGAKVTPRAELEVPEPTLRKKAGPYESPLTSQLTEAEMGPTTMNWVQTRKGQEYLKRLEDLIAEHKGDVNALRVFRDQFAPRKRDSIKGDIFDALIPPEQLSQPLAVKTHERAAEPSVGTPRPVSEVTDIGAAADAQLPLNFDDAGMGRHPADAGADTRSEAVQREPLTEAPKEPLPEEAVQPAQAAAPEAVSDIRAQLQEVLNDPKARTEIKRSAFGLLDSLENPELNETEADRAQNEAYVAKEAQALLERPRYQEATNTTEESTPEWRDLHDDTVAELEAGNLAGALAHVAERVPNPVMSAVADRLKMLVGPTQAVVVDKITTSEGIRAKGAADVDGRRVQLDRKLGLNNETVLHEAIHAASEHVLRMDPAKWTPQQRVAIQELKTIWDAAKRTEGLKLRDTARESLSEFVAEALSDVRIQAQLRQIPWKRTTGWEGFKQSILKMLGINVPNNMLEATLSSMDTVFARPTPQVMGSPMKPAYSLANIVETSEAYQGQPGHIQRAMKSFMEAFSDAGGVSPATKFRTLTVDTAASVEGRINRLFDGAVRSARGLANPMGLYRQAQDSVKLMLPFVRDGELVKNPLTGTYETRAAADSTAKVLDSVRDWGKKNGMDYDTASVSVSKMLEAYRLDGLRKSNAAGQTDVPINKLSNKDPRTADQQIDAALAEMAKHPEVMDIKRRLDDIKNKLVDQMASVGRISKEDATAWKLAVDYVPFDRIRDLDADSKFVVRRTTGKGLAQLGNLPELVGSKAREVGNVLENSMRLQGWMVSQIVRQDATLGTLRMLDAMGMAKFHRSPAAVDPAQRVKTYVNGKDAYFELPSRWDVAAFSELAQPKGAIVNMFQGFANVLRKTVTSMPPFALKQVVMDVQRAFATSGVQNPYALIYPTLKNFLAISGTKLFTGKDHRLIQQFERFGVVGEYDMNMRDPAVSILQDLGLRSRGPVKEAIHRLEGITLASDLATRAAIYEQTIKETGDAATAQVRAREFVNFRRRGSGSAMPTLTATIPFFNAYLQGMDVLYRAATGKGSSASVSSRAAGQQFMNRALTMTMLSTMYAIMRAGDDDYEEVDPRVKANNFLLPGGAMIPVPGELGALFKVPVETALDYFRRKGTPEEIEASEAAVTALRYAFTQYAAPMPIPTAIKPVLEAMTNYSFFTHQALEGNYQQTLDPSQRTNSRTSELAQAIANFTSAQFGEGMAISPIKIDNFLQGYFGTVAGNVAMLTDQVLNPNRLDRPMNKYWMASVFMYDPTPVARKEEAYQINDEIASKLTTLKSLQTSDPDRAYEYAEANREDLAMAKALQLAFKQSGKVRKEIKWLTSAPQGATDYTKEERQAKIDELRKLDNELFGWVREHRNYLKNEPQ